MMRYQVEASKEFTHYGWYPGVSLDEIRNWMIANDVPEDALIRYAGCGTHNIEFVWEARPGEERDTILEIREQLARRENERLERLRAEGVLA